VTEYKLPSNGAGCPSRISVLQSKNEELCKVFQLIETVAAVTFFIKER
jgi:hypothetical protein